MGKPFNARNAYYLRISRTSVLPLYLYLDDRHIDWMTDRILQHVLADLKPLIPAKLEAEADVHLSLGGPSNAKKGTVDVHRGEDYQFAFFFRRTEPHAVLIKSRDFVLAPPTPKPAKTLGHTRPNAAAMATSKDKQRPSRASSSAPKTKGAPKKRRRKARSEDESSDSATNDVPDLIPKRARPKPRPVRSTRANKAPLTNYQGEDEGMEELLVDEPARTRSALPDGPAESNDTGTNQVKVEEQDEFVQPSPTSPSGPSRTVIDIDEDEDEDIKPKPILQLKYKGFEIAGRCLCVVVEPWPPVRAAARAPSVASTSRAPSIAPPDFVTSAQIAAAARARTPLFLPDDDDDDDELGGRGQTPFVPPKFPQRRLMPPVPAFDDPDQDNEDEDEDGGGELMQFSQALRTANAYRTGEGDDDDELDGGVLFGDADEAREL